MFSRLPDFQRTNRWVSHRWLDTWELYQSRNTCFWLVPSHYQQIKHLKTSMSKYSVFLPGVHMIYDMYITWVYIQPVGICIHDMRIFSFYCLCVDNGKGVHEEWLTHWGQDKMAAIFQTTFWNGFSWMKMYEYRLKFHWSLFLVVQLTIFRHWFRWWLVAFQATSHYLNQWWLIHWRIYASLGPNELIIFAMFEKVNIANTHPGYRLSRCYLPVKRAHFPPGHPSVGQIATPWRPFL